MKNKVIRRIFGFIAGAVMCFGILTISAAAQEDIPMDAAESGMDAAFAEEQVQGAAQDVTIGDYTYSIENGVAMIKSFNSTTATEVTVPAEVTYSGTTYKVNTVMDKAYANKTNIKKLIIPAGITNVGNNAFANCTALESITIGGNLADANSNSIATESWKHYTNHSVFLNAGKNASSLTVTFTDDVTVIPAYLFATGGSTTDGTCAHVTKVVIGKSVTDISPCAFYNCYDLNEVAFGSSLVNIGDKAFINNTRLSFPDFTDSIKTVGLYAFSNCSSFDKILLPANVTEIKQGAFAGCTGVKDITVKGNSNIGEDAFEGCTAVTDVTLEGNGSLGLNAFANATALSSVTIKGNLADANSNSIATESWKHYTNHSVFLNAGKNAPSLKVIFTGEAKTIPSYLFATGGSISDGTHACITELVIDKSVTDIGAYAFYDCYDLKEVTFGSSLVNIGDHAFENNVKLSFPVFTDSIKKVGKNAFSNCTSFEKILTSANVSEIQAGAFAGCTGVKDITVKGNSDIGEDAFEGCTAVKSVTLEGNGGLGPNAFANATSLSSLTIKGNLADANVNSIATESWKYYTNNSVFLNAGKNADSFKVTFEDGVKTIPGYIFATAGSVSDGTHACVTDVVIGKSVTDINAYAFYNCYDLKEVTFGSSLVNIGDYAFANDVKLSFPAFTAGIKTVGKNAFSNCTSFDKVVLPTNVAQLQTGAFNGCTGVKDITVKGNTDIGEDAFNGCTAVTAVTLEGNGSLGPNAFANTTSLSTLTVKGNLADAGPNSASTENWRHYRDNAVFLDAGRNASSFTVEFKAGVTAIPAFIFATGATISDGDYVHVKSVYIPVSVKSIGKNAFLNCHDLKKITFGGTAARFAEFTQEDGNDYSAYEIEYENTKYNEKDWDNPNPGKEDEDISSEPESPEVKEAIEENKGAVNDTTGLTEDHSKNKPVYTVSPSQNKAVITVMKGSKFTITGAVTKEFSSESKEVKVNKKGVVSAKKPVKMAAISYLPADGKSKRILYVNVIDPALTTTKASGGTVKKLNLTVKEGSAVDATLSIPLTATVGTIKGKTSNIEGLSIRMSSSGLHITGKAVKSGKITIPVTSMGKTVKVKLIVAASRS